MLHKRPGWRLNDENTIRVSRILRDRYRDDCRARAVESCTANAATNDAGAANSRAITARVGDGQSG
jgi:hypothetical protein